MTPWNPTSIVSLHRSLGTSTEPVRIETDQGGAYAKFPGNPAGTHTLTCELIGGLAARFLGLRTFESAVLKVDEKELVQFQSGRYADTGSVILLKYQDGSPWDGEPETLKEARNYSDAAGFIVLDTWLQNCDRYRAHGPNPIDRPDNIFMGRFQGTASGKGGFEMIAMDHTHVMTCGWAISKKIANIDKVRERQLYGNFPGFRPFVSNETFHRFVDKLTQFGKTDAEAWMELIPRDWPPDQEVRLRLCEYLHARACFVADNIGDMLSEAGFIEPELEGGDE